ncbi:hypothetical protein C2S52_007377 [Perilla frutescens var. hirtella]|nr:hypothetical protein C2S52_007377 [Perilla frutescens var. hirtella]
MALKFLNKKGWHTGSLRNIENVWKAEQKHDAEQKKLEELRKQIHEERERADFRQLQEQAGLISGQERLEFLYDSGLAVGKGSSGFKALESIPKTQPEPAASDSTSEKPESAVLGALFEEKPQSANDAWRKLHSDPLLLIRQREQEALARIKNNPVQMAMIRKSVEAKKSKCKDEKRERKKHHKKKSEHRMNSDNDSEATGLTVEKHRESHHKGTTSGRHSSKRIHTSDDETSQGDTRRKKYYDEYKDRRPSGSPNCKYDKFDDHYKSKKNYYNSQQKEYSSERQPESRHEKGSYFNTSDKPPRHESNNRHRRPVKLTEEERAAKLKEMEMDAERHEEQRWKRLEKAADADAKEAIHDSASSGRNFLDAAQKSVYGAEKGGSSTIEESVRRRTHYSQRRSDKVVRLKHPALHLPLYHVRGQGPDSLQKSDATLPFSDVLALDDARVKFLNSRLNKKNLTAVVPAVISGRSESGGLIKGTSVSSPLSPGQSLGVGNYYTKIGLGTPPTYYPVVVDTGSSLSWIQCAPCLGYCHPQVGPLFNPSASDTYQILSCDTNECTSLKDATLNSPMCTSSDKCVYTATYGDQSFSQGYLSKDSLTFGAASLPSFVFGCGENNDGLFGKSAGLFGLAKNSLSMLSQLSTKYGKAFSYCLPTSSPLGKTGGGGYLSIGTGSSSAYKFTPMLSDSSDSTLYFLKLSAISVSGKPLGVAASGYSVPTIIDSGTTISRLSSPVYTALREELVKVISSKYKLTEGFSILDACFVGSADEIAGVVPPVALIFQGGAELKLEPQNVIIEVEKGTTCLSFAGNSNLRDSISIIGNQQQQTFDIVYDITGSRIGFAAGGCH